MDWRKTLAGLIGILVMIFSMQIGKFVGSTSVARFYEGKSDGVLEKAQSEAAAEISKQLPRKVDELTTLLSVFSMGPKLVYSYRIEAPTAQLQKVNFPELMRPMLTKNVCGKLASVISQGGSYEYIYASNEGETIGDLTFDKNACAMTGSLPTTGR